MTMTMTVKRGLHGNRERNKESRRRRDRNDKTKRERENGTFIPGIDTVCDVQQEPETDDTLCDIPQEPQNPMKPYVVYSRNPRN